LAIELSLEACREALLAEALTALTSATAARPMTPVIRLDAIASPGALLAHSDATLADAIRFVGRGDGALAIAWHHLASLPMEAAQARVSFKATLAMLRPVSVTKVLWLLDGVLGPEVLVTLLAITFLAEPACDRLVHETTANQADGQMPITAIKAAVGLLILWTKPYMAAGAAILVLVMELARLPTNPSPFVRCVVNRGLHGLLALLDRMRAFRVATVQVALQVATDGIDLCFVLGGDLGTSFARRLHDVCDFCISRCLEWDELRRCSCPQSLPLVISLLSENLTYGSRPGARAAHAHAQ